MSNLCDQLEMILPAERNCRFTNFTPEEEQERRYGEFSVQQIFQYATNLKRHERQKHEQQQQATSTSVSSGAAAGGTTSAPLYFCGLCDSTFCRSDVLKKHLKLFHDQTDLYKCFYCRSVYGTRECLVQHVRENHDLSSAVPKTPATTTQADFLLIEESRSSIKNFFQTFRITAGKGLDPLSLLHTHYHPIKQFVEGKLRDIGPLKFQLVLKIQLSKPLAEMAPRNLSPTILGVEHYRSWLAPGWKKMISTDLRTKFRPVGIFTVITDLVLLLIKSSHST